MDGHTHTDTLTDAALEREVESLLGVEPSPEFLARVRTRVAEEPAPTFWRLGRRGASDTPFRWMFAAVAAAVVFTATTVVWRSPEPARSADRPVRPPLVAETSTPPVPSSRAERVAPPAPTIEPAQRVPKALRARQETAAPEGNALVAIVSPEEAKAFDLLLASIRKPDVVLVLNDDTAGPVALSTPGIEIAPINIEPVPPVAQLEGGLE